MTAGPYGLGAELAGDRSVPRVGALVSRPIRCGWCRAHTREIEAAGDDLAETQALADEREERCQCDPVPTGRVSFEAVRAYGDAMAGERRVLARGECGHDVQTAAWDPGYGYCGACGKYEPRRVRLVAPVIALPALPARAA